MKIKTQNTGGKAWAWGRNKHGELGAGIGDPHRASLTSVMLGSGGDGNGNGNGDGKGDSKGALYYCIGASGGKAHSALIVRRGGVSCLWVCGSSRYGRLGVGVIKESELGKRCRLRGTTAVSSVAAAGVGDRVKTGKEPLKPLHYDLLSFVRVGFFDKLAPTEVRGY